MRTIGLIGGMSWESTALYYRHINEGVRDRLGGLASAELLLDSVDFRAVTQLQRAGHWDQAAELLAGRGRRLERAGADCLLICTNTMHLVHQQVSDEVAIPVLHIADAAATAMTRAGVTTVALLGTAFTMEQSFYRDRLEQHGIATLVPDAEDRAMIHRVIFDELACGRVDEDSRAEYRRVINDLVARGADGVVLGCTEIEILVREQDSPVPVFPTAALHAQAAVEFALTG